MEERACDRPFVYVIFARKIGNPHDDNERNGCKSFCGASFTRLFIDSVAESVDRGGNLQ